MSLVAYGSSDESDEEGTNCETHTAPQISISVVGGKSSSEDTLKNSDSPVGESKVENTGVFKSCSEENEDSHENVERNSDPFLELSKPKLFASLPRPVNSSVTDVEYVPNSVNDRSHKTKKSPVKITVPSVLEFEDVKDERKKPKKEKQMPVKASKLFNILPPPKNKCVKERDRPLVPGIVNKKSSSLNLNTKPAKKPKFIDDDDDDGDAQDFFSLKSTAHEISGNWAPIVVSEMSTSGSEVVKLQEEATPPASVSSLSPSLLSAEEGLQLDSEAFKRLGGRKTNLEEVNFIDISEEAVLPDSNEWLTKQLTVETQAHMHHSHRRNEGPTTQQRRKHQITYLAFQAKEKELELKNQWSQSRMSRKQTQSKYGF